MICAICGNKLIEMGRLNYVASHIVGLELKARYMDTTSVYSGKNLFMCLDCETKLHENLIALERGEIDERTDRT